MRQVVAKRIRRVLSDREEILRAFVAKYGFDPDQCQQVESAGRWCVVRLAPERVEQIQREVILAKLRRKKFTKWQAFCLWLGGAW
jgi:hypothetical protein